MKDIGIDTHESNRINTSWRVRYSWLVSLVIWTLSVWAYAFVVDLIGSTRRPLEMFWILWPLVIVGFAVAWLNLKRWRGRNPSARIKPALGWAALLAALSLVVLGLFWEQERFVCAGLSVPILIGVACFYRKTGLDQPPPQSRFLKIMTVFLIGAITLFWPYEKAKAEDRGSAQPGSVAVACLVVAVGVGLVIGGYYVYKALCKLQGNINKQQQDPDDPPPSTNAPPTNPTPPPPNPPKSSSPSGPAVGAQIVSGGVAADELAFIMGKLVMTNGWTTTDISSFSSTNLALLDPAIGQPYTLWSRAAVFWSTNLASLPGTNSASSWMKDPSKCAIRIRIWTTSPIIDLGDGQIGYGSPVSQLTVVDGTLVTPLTNYCQCQIPGGFNYIADLDSITNQIQYVPRPLDKGIRSKFFELSPADTQ